MATRSGGSGATIGRNQGAIRLGLTSHRVTRQLLLPAAVSVAIALAQRSLIAKKATSLAQYKKVTLKPPARKSARNL